jgi:hypothetical protein
MSIILVKITYNNYILTNKVVIIEIHVKLAGCTQFAKQSQIS